MEVSPVTETGRSRRPAGAGPRELAGYLGGNWVLGAGGAWLAVGGVAV